MIKCIVCFDVRTSKANKAINKLLKGYGCRVQKSVYEILVNYNELDKVSQDIANIIDLDYDSCIIYNLGDKDKQNTINIGKPKNLIANLLSEGYIVI